MASRTSQSTRFDKPETRRPSSNHAYAASSMYRGEERKLTLMQRFPVQMMCWILPGTSMDLNLAGRSGARCGMCRSPSARTSTIGLGIGGRKGDGGGRWRAIRIAQPALLSWNGDDQIFHSNP